MGMFMSYLRLTSTYCSGYMKDPVNNIGNIFYGSKGYMIKNVEEWQTFMGKEKQPGQKGNGLGNHYQVFCDAVRANDRSKLTSQVYEGHCSAASIHLANVSYRLGRSLNFDPVKEEFIGDDEANRMLKREGRSPYAIPEIV